MNGPQHYREAERCINYASNTDAETFDSEAQYQIAAAQVHAILALTAAVATLDATEGPAGGSATGRISDDSVGWAEVLGEVKS